MQTPSQSTPISHLRLGTYYTIINTSTGLALSMPKTNKYSKDKPEFQDHDPNNINQLWMIQEIAPNRYQIVHAISTLVLQAMPGSNLCKLEFGKQKNSQLYFLEEGVVEAPIQNRNGTGLTNKSDIAQYQPPLPHVVKKAMEEQKMVTSQSKMKSGVRSSIKTSVFKAGERFVAKIRIKQREKSRRYLYCDQVTKTVTAPSQIQGESKLNMLQAKISVLKFMQVDLANKPQSSLWQIRQVFTQQNEMLAKTCYIASFRSGQVLDIPEASDRQGMQIIQYPCNFRFNQKWILKKVDELNGYNYYMIMSAKTGLVLDIKGQSTKQNTPIIQWQDHQSRNQIWRLEEQGKKTYLIRSALDKQLLLGVRQNSVKECAEIVTSKVETQCFWVIHGFVPE